MNLGALLTACLAHTSFEKEGCRDKLQLRLLQNISSIFLLILGVAVRSGRLFSIAKADWATRKLLVVGSREVAVPKRLLYIEVIVVSIRT